jgi:uncharacterized protein YkwD
VTKPKLVVLLAILAAVTSASGVAAASPSGVQLQVDAQLQLLIVKDLNAVRRSHGLRPLRNSATLETAARDHSDEMASYGYFGHNSLNGSSFANRIKVYYWRGYERFSAGENLFWATGEPTAEGVIAAWAASAPHRANLFNAGWHEIGVSAIHASAAPGAFGGGDVMIITADFGTRS